MLTWSMQWDARAAHYAVLRGNLPALELLLNNGADINLTDNDGNTPLDLCARAQEREDARCSVAGCRG